MRTLLLFIILGLLGVSCSDEGENPPTESILTILLPGESEEVLDTALIDPTIPDDISEVLIFPNNSTSQDGNPPNTTNGSDRPVVNTQITSYTSSNGSTVPLVFSYDNAVNNLAGCYVQVDGAGEYYTVPYPDNNSGTSGTLQLPLTIPTNVDLGTFCLLFCVYDSDGEISNVINSCIDVLRLGTGSLQVSLSWDTPTDQDLHVTDPSGTEIFYANRSSSTGGALDRDDLDGYGPENIFWLDNAPDGEYTVEVKDFNSTPTPNNFFITVSGFNITRSFQGSTQNGSKELVTTFRKQGDDIVF